jgi:hypothetical protein
MILAAPFVMPAAADATVFRRQFVSGSSYLVVELLDDDLVHFEVASGTPPAMVEPLYTSPMVFKTDYTGATAATQIGNVIETNEMRLEIDAANLCINILDKKKQNANLTTLCPKDLSQPLKGLDINPSQIQNIYGLGQEFKTPGSADGDWTTLGVREGQEFGNAFRQFQGGATGNVQIPVYYAVGRDNLNYALMMDNVYKQRWDFTKFWW